ncbi:MAG: serine hydrolase domain-containing protein [Verrucomicrobiales bacterium]
MKYSILFLLLFFVTIVRAQSDSSALQPVLDSLVENEIVPGVVVLVANKDGDVAVKKSGYASLTNETPIEEDSVFWIASMSKSLTGAALMILVDEGKVNLDDPVEKYLPVFTGQQIKAEDGTLHPPGHPITVREIMSHTSGLVLASDKGLKHSQSLEIDIEEYATWPLRQEPGTKYEYNNCGINTGGRIIEVVSGMSFPDFMQKRFFDPLGMKDTTFWPNDEQADRLARSARFNEDKTGLEEVKLDPNVTPEAIAKFSGGVHVPREIIADMGFGISFEYGKRYGQPAGGYFSTAHDLGVFCRMLLNKGILDGKRFLSEKAVQEMATSQTNGVPVSPSETYGVGWSIKLKNDEGPAVGSYGHRGARRPAMWIDPTNDLVIVILVERFDMTGEEQKQLYGPIMKAAVSAFGKSSR